jgi:hypothetical protein
VKAQVYNKMKMKIKNIHIKKYVSSDVDITITYKILDQSLHHTIVNDLKSRIEVETIDIERWYEIMQFSMPLRSRFESIKRNHDKYLTIKMKVYPNNHFQKQNITKEEIQNILSSKKNALLNIKADEAWRRMVSQLSIEMSRYE